MDWFFVLTSAWNAAGAVLAETNPVPNGGIVIDLLDMQWWQAVLAIIGTLGLSPAPWILGLATGKIQFAAVAREDFARQVKEREAAHQRELAGQTAHHQALMEVERGRYSELQRAADKNATAAERERLRADEVTDALFQVGDVIRGAEHFMASALEAGQREVNERGT